MKITVEICVCAKCVLNGSLQLIESVESLQALKSTLNIVDDIAVTTSTLCEKEASLHECPCVKINGQIVKGANPETIMSSIIDTCTKSA